ncbi:MAG TPA: AAA family ATPase [Malonomonas sp.]
MARKLYISAIGQHCGKTTASLSLLHLAQKKYPRVGFIKPLGPKPISFKGVTIDSDVALMAQVFDLKHGLRQMSPVIIERYTTREFIDGKIDARQLEQRVIESCHAIEQECDFLIIEGSGHPAVGSVIGLSNAHIASALKAPVLMITGGGIGNVVDAVQQNRQLFEQKGVEIRGIMANKLIPDKRDATLDYLDKVFAQESFKLFRGFNYQPVLANPTMQRVATILNLELHGNQDDANRIALNLQIGAPSTQRVTELLRDSTLLIVTSSRDELLVTLANMYQIPEYRQQIAGLLIPGIAEISSITQLILDNSKIPYIRTTSHTTGQLYQIVNEDVAKLVAEDTEKIRLVRKLAEMRFNFDELDQLLDR